MKPIAANFETGSQPGDQIAGAARLPLRRLPGGVASTASRSAKPRAAEAKKTSRSLGSKPLPKRELLTIVTQLAIMTRSGVDVADAIRSIAARATHPIVRNALQKLHLAIEEGSRLSQAMAAQGDRFGGIVIASIAAGEASGTLPEVFSRLRVLMRDELRTRSAIRSVISYPIVLTAVTLSVMVAMIFFVLPQFAGIYETSQAPTPAVTQFLLTASGTLREYWWVAVLLVVGGVAGAWQLLHTAAGRVWLDRLVFRLPLLRDISRPLGMGRVFRLQGVLLESGVPLLEVLRLTKRVSVNTLLRELNERMQQAVLVGQSMSSALARSECVPEGALDMVATAEANGQLAGVLQTVGEFYESEGEQSLKDVVKIAEPVIIVALGLVVGAIVLAVMLPMLDLSAVGGR